MPTHAPSFPPELAPLQRWVAVTQDLLVWLGQAQRLHAELAGESLRSTLVAAQDAWASPRAETWASLPVRIAGRQVELAARGLAEQGSLLFQAGLQWAGAAQPPPDVRA